MSVVDGLQCLDYAPFFDALVDARPAPHARRVDQDIGAAVPFEGYFDGIPRGAGLIEGDEAFVAEEAVDQRRLADIRPTNDTDSNRAIDVHGRIRDVRRNSRQRRLDQVIDSLAVRGGHGLRLAEPEAMELGDHDRGIAALALVDRDRHRLAAPAKHIGNEAVRRIESALTVDQKYDAIGLLDRTPGLLRHQFLHAARRFDESAGVDDDELMRLAPAVAVLAIARDARNVGDERVARAGQGIEERRLADIRPADEGDDWKHGMR